MLMTRLVFVVSVNGSVGFKLEPAVVCAGSLKGAEKDEDEEDLALALVREFDVWRRGTGTSSILELDKAVMVAVPKHVPAMNSL